MLNIYLWDASQMITNYEKQFDILCCKIKQNWRNKKYGF